MVDVGVHQALLVSVLGNPQDLGGGGRERWDGNVHMVPGGHGEQGGDLCIRALEISILWPQVHSRGPTQVSLRTQGGVGMFNQVYCQIPHQPICSTGQARLTFAPSPLSGVLEAWAACPFLCHSSVCLLTWLEQGNRFVAFTGKCSTLLSLTAISHKSNKPPFTMTRIFLAQHHTKKPLTLYFVTYYLPTHHFQQSVAVLDLGTSPGRKPELVTKSEAQWYVQKGGLCVLIAWKSYCVKNLKCVCLLQFVAI